MDTEKRSLDSILRSLHLYADTIVDSHHLIHEEVNRLLDDLDMQALSFEHRVDEVRFRQRYIAEMVVHIFYAGRMEGKKQACRKMIDVLTSHGG
jgi:hypothetical protein